MFDFDVTRVRNLLRGKGINIDELAVKSGVKRGTLYNYLNGTTPITVEALILLSNACDINLFEIINNSNILNKNIEQKEGVLNIKKNDDKNDDKSDTKPKMQILSSLADAKYNSGYSIERYLEKDPTGNYTPIPLYGQEAAAGFGSVDFALQEHDIQREYIVPDFKKIDFMIRINGSSMYPKYNSGDVIAVRVLHERAFIQWNKVHLIATKEQGLLVKRLKKSANDKFIVCASDNKEYDAFEVPWKEIQGVALVIGVIRLE